MNDYDPAWDYKIDPKPDARVVRVVNGLLKRSGFKARSKAARPALYNLLKRLGLKKVNVGYIKGSKKTGIAVYVSGTSDHPWILIDAKAHAKGAEEIFSATGPRDEGGVLVNDLGHTIDNEINDGVRVSVVHELFHAYLETCGLDPTEGTHDEDVVEEAARTYWDEGTGSALEILDAAVSKYDTLGKS